MTRAVSSLTLYDNPYGDLAAIGFGDVQPMASKVLYGPPSLAQQPRDYQEEIAQCRHFYRYDAVASTVVNRIVDIAITELQNRRNGCTDVELAYFNAIAEQLEPALASMAIEYLVAGMAIPDYVQDRELGRKLHPSLGRTRIVYPRAVWLRNPVHITLKRIPCSMDRAVYLKVSSDERYFITHSGEYQDGTVDRDLYERIKTQFPEYVQMVASGVTNIPLPNVNPLMRKLMPTQEYPQPYLVPALAALKHKQRIKRMDYDMASKAIDAIRLVRAGNDAHPLVDDDPMLSELKAQMNSRDNAYRDIIYTLFTNHTVNMEWVFPPLDALLSQDKYAEPNADILTALGFSKVLLVGESDRSNAGQQNNSTLGPVSTLNEIRRAVLRWVTWLYKEMAEVNGFKTIAKPTFKPINAGDVQALASLAVQAVKLDAASRDLMARMLGSDFDTEHEQIVYEETRRTNELYPLIAPDPTTPQDTNAQPADTTETE